MIFWLSVGAICCYGSSPSEVKNKGQRISVGAERMGAYVSLLKGKKVALVVNQTSMVGGTHLVDTLRSAGVEIAKIFAPEHGFRGDADAGAHITNATDTRTGIPIVSLYGKKQKPQREDLSDVEIVVFDIQDVGCRFYTFLSTLHYVMEGCAENDKVLILLDRPNPNGYYIDGPVLDMKYSSFVGIAPVPVVHGLTLGEYAKMAVGEHWIAKADSLKLIVIPCTEYDHSMHYKLPVKPSPNLPNARAVLLYPSLCFFEGTNVSVGRGTSYPFQVIGSPYYKADSGVAYSFVPVPKAGAMDPPFKGKECRGYDLRKPNNKLHSEMNGLNLYYLKEMYDHQSGAEFVSNVEFFDKLAGSDELRKQLMSHKTINEIKDSWKKGLESYKVMRKKYLLYKDF